MSGRFFSLIISLISCLIYALSAGGAIFYLFALCLFLMLLFALLSIFLSKGFMKIDIRADRDKVERGDKINLSFFAKSLSLIPIGPIKLVFDSTIQSATKTPFILINADKRQNSFSQGLSFAHVGEFMLGLSEIQLSDIFGLFKIRLKNNMPKLRILSLPKDFELPALVPNKNYEGKPLLNQSGEDINAPNDTRTYRAGDAMKRVHWKLSARLREIVVRKFEVPSPPETLLYLNLNLPKELKGEEMLYLKDSLLETALAVAKVQLNKDYTVLMPLVMGNKREITLSHPSMLNNFQELLARLDFNRAQPFHKELIQGLVRARKSASIAVVLSELDAQIVEAIVNLRKTGPSLRVYFMADEEKANNALAFIARLKHALVEVCYVN